MARAGQQQSRLVHKDGVTLPLRERREVAVLVAGGGVAGVYAALGAADHGRGVLLVEQHAFVGGQGTAGGVHTFCGETRFVNDRWREMLRRLHTFGGISAYRANADGRAFDCESQKFVLQEMLAEAGVELLLHTQVLAVERSGDRLPAVILANKSGLPLRRRSRFALTPPSRDDQVRPPRLSTTSGGDGACRRRSAAAISTGGCQRSSAGTAGAARRMGPEARYPGRWLARPW